MQVVAHCARLEWGLSADVVRLSTCRGSTRADRRGAVPTRGVPTIHHVGSQPRHHQKAHRWCVATTNVTCTAMDQFDIPWRSSSEGAVIADAPVSRCTAPQRVVCVQTSGLCTSPADCGLLFTRVRPFGLEPVAVASTSEAGQISTQLAAPVRLTDFPLRVSVCVHQLSGK
jgi:hypothetical protein